MTMRRAVAVAAAVCALAVGPVPANAATIPVADSSSFTSALASARPGDVIQLAAATFPRLTVSAVKYSTPVTIVGSQGTVVGGFSISHARNVTISGLTISPANGIDAVTTVDKSEGISFDRVQFVGANPGGGVGLDISSSSSSIQVTGSEFTLCHSFCLQPSGSGITVTTTNFHDCYDCDMIRGGGSGVTLSGNTFVRALKGPGGNHNDLLQITGGGPWTISGNHFGTHEHGAAQIYVNPGSGNSSKPVHDLTIASNLFDGDTGYAVRLGVGSASAVGAPTAVRIVNNTIVSGKNASVFLVSGWASVAPTARPIVANNIIGVSSRQCELATWSHNLDLTGTSCPGDSSGTLSIGTDGVPAASPLIVGQGDPAYAPKTDFFGHPRNTAAPTIGAVELGGAPPPATLRLTAPKAMSARLRQLKAAGWRLTVPLTLKGAATLVVHVQVGGKSVTTTTRRTVGLTAYRLVLVLPAAARRAGTVTIAMAATSGAHVVKATTVVKIRR